VTQTSIERHFPVNELSALARVERPDLARPALYMHKWWARRFGSVFRSIILATFLPPEANARWLPTLDIDRVHFLYAEYRYGANFRQYRERWRSQALDELCRYLAEVTGDTIYDKIVEAAF